MDISYDDLFEDIDVTVSDFKYQQPKVHLTYKEHFDIQRYLKFMFQQFPDNPLIYYSVVNEVSDDGYEHMHAFIQWKTKLCVRNPRRFDYHGVHPHFRKVKTKNHFVNIIRYHTKTDAKPVTNIDIDLPPKQERSRRMNISSMPVKEVRSILKDEYDNNLEKMVDEENLTYRDRSTLISGYLSSRRIEVKTGEPPELIIRANVSEIESLSKENTKRVFWYYSTPDVNVRITSHYKDWVEGTFVVDPISYFQTASIAENHQIRGGGFKNIFIAFDSVDSIPKDFEKTLVKFKKGIVQGGRRSLSLEFDEPNIFILSMNPPNLKLLECPELDLVIRYEELFIDKSNIAKYTTIIDGNKTVDMSKIKEEWKRIVSGR